MTSPEPLKSKGTVTTFLNEIDPIEALIRKRVKERMNEEEQNKRKQLATQGDIWGLMSKIPFEELPNNSLLIEAAINREKENETEPTMRYTTFIYCVKTAQTPEEILHAIPTEWIGGTIYQQILPKVK